MAARGATASERFLIGLALQRADLDVDVSTLLVHETGPGTAVITRTRNLANARPSGAPVETIGFWDSDAVPVLVDVFLDDARNFAEIDIWKANGVPIQRWPTEALEVLSESVLHQPPGHA